MWKTIATINGIEVMAPVKQPQKPAPKPIQIIVTTGEVLP